MSPFAFHRAANVAAAQTLRQQHADGNYLAGGQSLLPAYQLVMK